MLKLKTPADHASVSLQTVEQETFLKEEQRRANMDGALTFCWFDLEKEGVERSFPRPVTFCWEETGETGSENGDCYWLLLSEKETMEAPWVYSAKQTSCEVYNLKVGTQYYWCVQKNGKRSEVFSFETLLTLPRCMKIDNISNVRDMGGYQVEEGRIRQGKVYRGGEFELHMQLTEAGMGELHRMGLRTELDMRGEVKDKVDFTTAELMGIKRVFVPLVGYAEVFEQEQSDALRTFFKVFAKPENYPIYYHCWGGADRTGTIAFILGAFLGMRLEDLINEYEFTSLAIWGIRSRNYEGFRRFLELFFDIPGETIRQKGENFLKQYAGLTDEQLTVIYDMLVERG